MENNCGTGIMGLREDEIELELGLSIGGSFGKAEKLKPIKKESKANDISVADPGEGLVFDPEMKRKIQALRRQEAKKKREEKQQKRGIAMSSRCHQNGDFRSKGNDVDATEERERKKNKVQGFSANESLHLGAELNYPSAYPVIPVPVPCPCPHLQFVPLGNGLPYSCVNSVPCWGGGGNEKGVLQPVAVNGGFEPLKRGQDSGVNEGNGYDSEQNSSKDERNRKTGSNGSPIYSSSVLSDLQSSSNQGGCSSEAGTNTSPCQLEHPQINCSVASNRKGQSEQSATSHQMDSEQSVDKCSRSIEKRPSLKATESTSLNPKKEPKLESQLYLNSKPVSTIESQTTTLTKDTNKGDMGKPPKTRTPTHDQIFSLRKMPCVSTTGNGPDGKTINGFLYRYTKSEVSIICVCHGSSFTPAEFVKHAGDSSLRSPVGQAQRPFKIQKKNPRNRQTTPKKGGERKSNQNERRSDLIQKKKKKRKFHIKKIRTKYSLLSHLSFLLLRLEFKSSGIKLAMASIEQQAPAGITAPTADVVGNAFVHQYYLILHQSPALVHRFYHDSSKLGRPEENGVMSITTTMQAINDKILSLGYGEFTAEITTVDAQDSHNGGVLVLVTGYLTGKDKVKQKFTQSFFLAPQDKGYFVLNDVFRFVDDTKHQSGSQDPVNNTEASLTPEQDPSPALENHIEQPAALPEEANGPEVYNPSENGNDIIEEEEAPLAEVADEIPDDSQFVAGSNSKIEDLPKKSYASIVKVMKENTLPLSVPTHFPVKSAVKSHEHPGVAAPPTAPAPASDAQISSNNVTENGNNQVVEAEGPSIYVKGLPLNATPSMLADEFKKFGPIKSGGIQVRSQKGFCFGFVEFEMASSVQSAIEASPINIGGRKAVVEEKRSTSRGNKGRSSSVSGAGYRNEGARGRGNYVGGRGYNRGEFGNRTEFGNRSNNRGGYSNRGGDGYQRGEHMGSNGGRVNRTGEPTFNAAAKNVAPRVSAPA